MSCIDVIDASIKAPGMWRTLDALGLMVKLEALVAEARAYRAALVTIARHVASPGAEDLADKLEVGDLDTLVECVTAEYGNGHAAGGQARMTRCRQDIARALGLDERRPPEWGELVERVRKMAADAAKESE